MKSMLNGLEETCSPNRMDANSAANGKERVDVMTPTAHSMHAQDAALGLMVPNSAQELRNRAPTTPYKANEWLNALMNVGILPRFHKIPIGLCNGFIVDFPTIATVQSLPNKDSINIYVDGFEKTI